MKVLLLKDVDNLGYAGEVKKVADGYGRNYLMPQNLAVLATTGAVKQAEAIRKAAEKQRATEMEDARAIANQISGVELVFERRAGETGKLYGSVTSGDIAEAIQRKSGIEVDKRKVALPEPIRALGKQEVVVKLMIDVTATVQVEVVPEGTILERDRQAARAAAQAAAAAAQAAAEPAVVAVTVVDTPAETADAEG